MKKRDIFINIVPFFIILCNYIFIGKMELLDLSYANTQLLFLATLPLLYVLYDYHISNNWKTLIVLYLVFIISQVVGYITSGYLYCLQVSNDSLTKLVATALAVYSTIYAIILGVMGIVFKKRYKKNKNQ